MATALIDGDILAYEVGFGSQHKIYFNKEGRYYESLSHAKEAGEDPKELSYKIEKESIGFAKGLLKDKINNIFEATNATDFKLYLTGKDNFREKIATILKYKGERGKQERPLHYQMLRDYMIERFGGIVVHGFEADDALAIEATKDKDNTIICSRDKDLRQMEGWHYSWAAHNQVEKPLSYINDIEGWYNLSVQMLTGDITDNILGVVGIGAAKAAKALKDCTTKEELNEAVLRTYNTVYGSVAGDGGAVHYTSWDGVKMWKTPREIARENYLLLRMLTESKWLEK